MITFLKYYFLITAFYFLVKSILTIRANIPAIKSTFKLLKAGLKLKEMLKPKTEVNIIPPLTQGETKALKNELQQANTKAEMWKNKYYQLLNNEPQDK